MSYALRNSLILSLLLCVVLGAGYYWVEIRQAGRIGVLKAHQQELREELATVGSVLAIYDATVEQLDRLTHRWDDRKRFIPKKDTPGRTLIYLDDLLQKVEGRVHYDFLFKGTRDEKAYQANVYGLEGNAKIENLHAFIWHLEHGPRFYTVDRLQIDYQEPEGGRSLPGVDWVKFSMVLRAYFNPQSHLEETIPAAVDQQPARLAGNIFNPLITRSLPPNHLGLLEVENAKLKGLTHEHAYLQDARGRLHILRPGERVYLGRLDKIDIFENRVEFVLNKGGISERLSLQF